MKEMKKIKIYLRIVLGYFLIALLVIGIFAVSSAAYWLIMLGICLIGQALPTFGLVIFAGLGGLITVVLFVLKDLDLIT